MQKLFYKYFQKYFFLKNKLIVKLFFRFKLITKDIIQSLSMDNWKEQRLI
jgi:hypothetical protein